MKPFKMLKEAREELEEASTWYEGQRVGLGLELVAEFRERLAWALDMPSTGAPAGRTFGGNEIRRFRLRRFQRYAIVLATIKGIPTVLAFEHSSRRPGYWRGRLK